ncbi:reverse transcriptase domain-containing protein [Tanacetum coccineum]
MADVKKYIWDDPYLFKSCPDGIVRRFIFGKESYEILKHYHTRPTGGYYGADITARKVFESGFYWPTNFKDSATYVRECDACQMAGNISSRNQMPMTNILVSEVKCKYVTRNTRKGSKNEENADSYEGLWHNTYDSVTPYPFDNRVTLGFGSIAGGLDPVSPVIRLPIECGINSGTRIGTLSQRVNNLFRLLDYLG